MSYKITFQPAILEQADGIVIGAGVLQGTEVTSFFVSPDWHRRGIGTALLKELEEIAARQGNKSLDVSSSLYATGFYVALGFIENTRKFYGDEETVLMSKSLENATAS